MSTPQDNRILLLLHQGYSSHWPGRARATPGGRVESMSHFPSWTVKYLPMAPALLQGQCPGCPATHSPCDTVLLGAGLATALGGLAGMVTRSSAQLPSCCGHHQGWDWKGNRWLFDIEQPSHAKQGEGTAAQRVSGADQWCPASVSQTQSHSPLPNRQHEHCAALLKGETTVSPWLVPGNPLCHLAGLKGSTGFAGRETPGTDRTHPCSCICAQRADHPKVSLRL